jgi:hypothetical protein
MKIQEWHKLLYLYIFKMSSADKNFISYDSNGNKITTKYNTKAFVPECEFVYLRKTARIYGETFVTYQLVQTIGKFKGSNLILLDDDQIVLSNRILKTDREIDLSNYHKPKGFPIMPK